jgi:hypothetical protein
MKIAKLFIVTILFVFISSKGFSQQTFSTDSTKFLKEIVGYFAQVNREDAKAFEKQFESIWFGGKFTPTIRANVYSTANLMVQKRLKPYPEIKNYMLSVMYAVNSGFTGKKFDDWHAIVDKTLAEKNKSRFEDFIETSSKIFRDNTIFESSSTIWKANNNKFTFVFDGEPKIIFDEFDLKCVAKNDSSVLYKTKGTYYPYSSTWEGNKGTITWERANLPRDKVYAEVKKYKISMKSTGFTSDSTLFYSEYFSKPILGLLQERVVSNRGAETVSFPKFTSYDQRLFIKNIFPNVDYDGGFTMEGGQLLGSGVSNNLAKLIFYYKDKKFFITESLVFIITKTEASAERAKSKFFIEYDSITHSGLTFQYKNKNNEQAVTLIRGQGISSTPFVNSYHKLDMYSEALFWKMGDPVIQFAPLFQSSDTTAKFISKDYFSIRNFDKYSGLGGANPLVSLRAFSKKIGTETLTLVDVTSALRTGKDDADVILYDMMVGGFLTYDNELGVVYLHDKLFNYVESRSNKRDYDVIEVISSTKQTNAELSLVSLDLIVKGVRDVLLSSTNNVKILPEKQELIIKKNRNMLFGGEVKSGRTEFYGKQFTFDYNDFKINLVECDSMRVIAKTVELGKPPFVRLGSAFHGVSGNIVIDAPNNKSGMDTTKRKYPILTSTKKTYVYYDSRKIQKGAYKRDNFKFIVEPFEMDSLNSFTNNGVGFKGEFISAGIFPNMKETLTIQEDYSLGFKRKAPKEGISIYGDKAMFDNEIRLSNKGLQGTGSIDFLTSHAVSDEITFFVDSLTAIAQTYKNEARDKKPEVPLVIGKDVYVSYIPKQKVLYASKIKNDLVMFDKGEAKLEGRLSLKPEGMTAIGKIYIANGELLSYNYVLKHHTIDADTAEFKLRTVELDEMGFRTENVKASVDLEKRKGHFQANGEQSPVEFPENQYVCYMDTFNWFIDEDNLEMESKKAANDLIIESGLDLSGSNFFSTHPKQDSLNFFSPKAKFDIKKKIIYCQGVEYILVADARIFPDSGLVNVEKKAKIQTLKNANILANSVTKYHQIFDAEVEINAKKDYKASGYYNYVDESKNQQKFFFSNIKPDTTFQTTAKGGVTTEDNFKLSAQFDYKGEIEMFASRKELTFKGEVKLSAHNCTGIDRNWMAFTAEIDPENIFIPVSKEQFDVAGNPVGTGMILNQDSVSIYSTFLSNKLDKKHINVMTADGFLRYDKDSKEYRVSSREKLQEINLPGQYLSLNTQNCEMRGDGRFDFGVELGLFETFPAGELRYDPSKNDLKMRASVAIKFPFNYDAIDKMGKNFEEKADTAVNFNNSTYEKSLREIIGLEKADKIMSDLNIYGKIKGKLPDELEVQLFLVDIDFVWDKNKSAYVSEGKIGIATIQKKQIFKSVEGKIAIYKRRTGDEISIYLNITGSNYYFFNYKRGLLQAYSTNEEFNQTISETKKDKTKFNAPKGKEDLSFMLGAKTKASAFLREFETE